MTPPTARSSFSGGDQQYLREVQYASGAKLDARSYLHRTFATSSIPLAEFEAALVPWVADASVLECGCGNGRFWETSSLPRSMRLTLTDLSAGMVDEVRARACTRCSASTPVNRVCASASARSCGTRSTTTAAVTRRFVDGRVRIHTRVVWW